MISLIDNCIRRNYYKVNAEKIISDIHFFFFWEKHKGFFFSARSHWCYALLERKNSGYTCVLYKFYKHGFPFFFVVRVVVLDISKCYLPHVSPKEKFSVSGKNSLHYFCTGHYFFSIFCGWTQFYLLKYTNRGFFDSNIFRLAWENDVTFHLPWVHMVFHTNVNT